MSSLKIISSIKNKKQKKKSSNCMTYEKKIKKTKTISLVSSFIVLCLPLKRKEKKTFLAIHLFKKEISEEIFCKIMKKNKSSVLVPSISVDKQKKNHDIFARKNHQKNFGQEKFLKQN